MACESVLPGESACHGLRQYIPHVARREHHSCEDMQVDFVLLLVDGIDDAVVLGIDVALVDHHSYLVDLVHLHIEAEEVGETGVCRRGVYPQLEMSVLEVKLSDAHGVFRVPCHLAVQLLQGLRRHPFHFLRPLWVSPFFLFSSALYTQQLAYRLSLPLCIEQQQQDSQGQYFYSDCH